MSRLTKLCFLLKEHGLAAKRFLRKKELSATNFPDHSIPGIYSTEKNYRFLSETVIGIDFEITKSCVAVMDKGVPKVLKDEDYKRSPSTTDFVVFFWKHLLVNIFSKITDKGWGSHISPYEVSSIMGLDNRMWNPNGILTPRQSTYSIIRKMKRTAEMFLNTTVSCVVIAVPYYFDSHQKWMVWLAAKVAGFKYIYVIDKELAAMLTSDVVYSGDQVIAVFNMGYYSTVASIIQRSKGHVERHSAIDDLFGEENFNDVLLNFFKETFMKQHGIDLTNDIVALCRLREAAIDAKTQLSQVPEVEINIPNLTSDSAGKFQHLNIKLTVEEYENLVGDLLQRIVPHCADALQSAIHELRFDEDRSYLHVNKIDKVDKVLLVGEMTKMPKIRKIVEEVYQQTADCKIEPDERVAIGAAIFGSRTFTCQPRDTEVSPLPRS